MNALTHRYLDELARDPEGARGLAGLVGDSPLPFPFAERLLARPSFLEGSELRQIEADILGVYDLLTSLPERLFAGDVERFGHAVGFDPAQTRTALRSAAEWPPPLVARADLYRDGAGFKLLELNLGSALGGFHVADVNRLLLRADLMRNFADRERLAFVDTMPLLADLLRRRHPSPVVALADWPDTYQVWEPSLRAMAEQFGELGIDARPCEIGELRANGGGLTLAGAHVDVVFRYFALAQATAEPEGRELFEPLARACERGQVELFTPLTTTLLASKQALVLLSDERHRPAFSGAELALIDRCLPWTRQLRDGAVHVDGVRVDLHDHCLESRDTLILKPGYLYSGHGVVAGWAVGDREWRAAIDDAWNGPFVVQRRVVPSPEPFPDPETGELRPWVVVWGVFVAGRRYGGCFNRCSPNLDDGVVNLDAGAWVATCFHGE